MKVSRIILALIASAFVATTHAESNDSIKLVRLEQTLQKEIKTRESLKTDLVLQKDLIKSQAGVIDSLRSAVDQNARNIKTTADVIGVKIDETNSTLDLKADSSDVKSKTIWGGIIIVLLTLIVSIISFVFGKLLAKRGNELASLSAKADKLNEEIVAHMSKEMTDMQNIAKQISSLASNPIANSDSEQKLIITLADRITFMEMTLYKMDSSVRGHKQLSKSIKQMKDNLHANGYELVDMLGKDYHGGMKVTAIFVEDENLPEGKQIITGIIKPQINYQGKMIQSAHITVSQNL